MVSFYIIIKLVTAFVYKLHNSTWGYLCPAETPEGGSIGVVKNLSYLATVTIESDSQPIREYINNEIITLHLFEGLHHSLI